MPKQNQETSRAIIVRQVKLAPRQLKVVNLRTPPEFIKEREGKKGKKFKYVEGGYVIARLNEAFSPIGWDFSIVSERVEPTEVVVRGKLMVKDYKSGFSISKTQYGTKTRYDEVPLGDTLKAASTDCLKKCASMFGIALDVYWPELDRGDKPDKVKIKEDLGSEKKTIKHAELFDFTVKKIEAENNESVLYQMIGKIKSADSKLYSETAKTKLIQVIKNKLGMKNGG